MKVTVQPDWKLQDAYEAALDAYSGIGITSQGYRNSVLKVWASIVGKKQAQKEIEQLIHASGSKRKAGEKLDMSPGVFLEFRKYVESLPNPPKTRRPKIFLCHASNDKEIAREIYHKLTGDGYDVWFDEESLVAGQDWNLEIQKSVSNTDLFLVCLSNNSRNKTGYIQKEITIALDFADYRPEGKAFIIPVRIEKCEVPLRLQPWQWVDYFDSNGYSKLIRALEANEIEIEND